jgi:putative endonuclease
MAFFVQNKLGAWGERIAEQQYLKRGYILVARNIYNTKGKRLGEIDLIFRGDKEVIFVEVKTRRKSKYGSAVESITPTKKLRLIRAVQWFLRMFPRYAKLRPRIDVCAIDIDKQAINVIIIPYAVTLDY